MARPAKQRRTTRSGLAPAREQRCAAEVGHPVPYVITSYRHVEAFEGELWCCEVCGAVVAKFSGGDFVDVEYSDVFERHGAWHKKIRELESRDERPGSRP